MLISHAHNTLYRAQYNIMYVVCIWVFSLKIHVSARSGLYFVSCITGSEKTGSSFITKKHARNTNVYSISLDLTSLCGALYQ